MVTHKLKVRLSRFTDILHNVVAMSQLFDKCEDEAEGLLVPLYSTHGGHKHIRPSSS